MPRRLTKTAARKMQSLRATRAGGRPKIPKACPKCNTPCESVRGALGHCA